MAPKKKSDEFLLGEINESCKWLKARLEEQNGIIRALKGGVLNRELQNG